MNSFSCHPGRKSQTVVRWPWHSSSRSLKLLCSVYLAVSLLLFAIYGYLCNSLTQKPRTWKHQSRQRPLVTGQHKNPRIKQCSLQKPHLNGSRQCKHFFYYIQHALHSMKLVLTSSIFYLILRAFLPAQALPFLQSLCWAEMYSDCRGEITRESREPEKANKISDDRVLLWGKCNKQFVLDLTAGGG